MSETAETSTDPYLLVEKCGSTRGVPIYVITKHVPSVIAIFSAWVSSLKIICSATGGYPHRTVCIAGLVHRIVKTDCVDRGK